VPTIESKSSASATARRRLRNRSNRSAHSCLMREEKKHVALLPIIANLPGLTHRRLGRVVFGIHGAGAQANVATGGRLRHPG
jgi:hypothetical protein